MRPSNASGAGRHGRLRRLWVFGLVVASQFALFEAGLRLLGGSEAAPEFQALFMNDPDIGYRLKPDAFAHFRTVEFATDIAINSSGVRDEAIGPKEGNERRVVVLGDSLVLAVQVPLEQTFCKLLEQRLNGCESPYRYRVIDAGVQGYGPVEELLFFRKIAQELQPDLVILALFVGNDAEEAAISAHRLDAEGRPAVAALQDSVEVRLRRLVRRSMVLQIVRLRLRSVVDRVAGFAPPEPPLPSYWPDPPPRVRRGVEVTRECVRELADAAVAVGARLAVLLLPARFQVDDADYGRLETIVQQAGGTLKRDGATELFTTALADLPVPQLDALPPLREASQTPSDVFFQQTMHLTPRGHDVVAQALDGFLRERRLVETCTRSTLPAEH